MQTAPAAALSEEQRAAYERQGWLAVPGLVDDAWLDRLRAVIAEFVEQSRALTESGSVGVVRRRAVTTAGPCREPARWARHDPRPCLMPPSGPYRPIFAAQQREP